MGVRKKATKQIDLGAVINALPGVVWTTRTDGHCDFVNQYWNEYTGLASDAALGNGWQAALHPEDLKTFADFRSAAQKSMKDREVDVRLRRFDGEYRWFTFRPSSMKGVGKAGRWCWLGINADEGVSTDARQRRLFDMLPWQAGFLDANGVLEFTNRQSLRDFGMTHEQLEQWTQSGIIHVDDHKRIHKAVSALLKTCDLFDEEHRMLYPDGVYRWTRARCVPIRDAHGNVVRHVTFQIDVDDLKRAETLLAAEVNLLELVARGETLGRILTVLGQQIEALCNDCLCSILLVAPDRKDFQVGAGPTVLGDFAELLRGGIDASQDPCSRAVVERSCVVAVDVLHDPRWQYSRWPSLLRTHGYGSCAAWPIISGSGEAVGVIAIYRVRSSAPTPQEHEVVDRFTKIAGIAIDRTSADVALRMRERELREALSQLAEGQRLSKTGSFTWEVRADRHDWSNEIRRTFDFKPDTTVTMAMIQAAVHPDDSVGFARMISAAAQDGRDFELMFRILTTGNELRHAHVVGHRVDPMTDRPVFIGALQDVTDRVLAEEGLNRARSELAHVSRVATLSTMTASITHEVSQPIAGIVNNASTLARMLAAEPPNLVGAAETVRRTIRDANRASEVIKRLRAMFTRKAATIEEVNLNDAAREVVALSAGELQRSRAALQAELLDGLPMVRGDRVQLQQVILNLLLNAVDAMTNVDDRPRTVLIRTEVCDGDTVRLIVRDSGVGVDPQALEKLFDAFYTTKAHGMGVGLAISRSIIKSHKGHLWAAANDGPGATFGFSMPSAARKG